MVTHGVCCCVVKMLRGAGLLLVPFYSLQLRDAQSSFTTEFRMQDGDGGLGCARLWCPWPSGGTSHPGVFRASGVPAAIVVHHRRRGS